MAVVPRTFRNGLGGKGVRHRREPTATKEVAIVVTRYLGHTYTFYEDASAVEKRDVESFLAEALTAVPDDLARPLRTSSHSIQSRPAMRSRRGWQKL
ncbi:conserved hypothetical protein [Agrobacterium sp. NCPPB 925]|nr:conserved hypothetical protein [Agrobacterium sp. NCPPB 925]